MKSPHICTYMVTFSEFTYLKILANSISLKISYKQWLLFKNIDHNICKLQVNALTTTQKCGHSAIGVLQASRHFYRARP
jgi:hypothetical protein